MASKTENAPVESATNSGPEKTFQAGLARGVFLIQKCGRCAKFVFYPRVVCDHCGADELQAVEVKGAARVYSTTTVRRKSEAGGDYNVSIVELDEGPRLMSRIDRITPDEVRIGMKVTATIVREDDQPIIVFIPASNER
jgi:uncharacterized OB-fold protein